MQEQKKANVLPGQVTLEDVERAAGLIEIEVRIPGEKPKLIRTRSYSISYVDLETKEGVNNSRFYSDVDAMVLYAIHRKNAAALECEYPKAVKKILEDEELAQWLTLPPEDYESSEEG